MFAAAAKKRAGVAAALVGVAVLASCSQPAFHEGDAPAAVSASKEPEVSGLQSRVRLLSQAQYFNTITGVFGKDVVPNVNFAPFQRTDGLLAAGAAYQGITDSQMELYQRAAAIVAGRVVSPERRDFLIPCTPANEKAADDACAAKFLDYIGKRLFRRPMPPEVRADVIAGAARGANRLGDFYAGLSLAIEGLLLSPNTLFNEEISEPDPQHPGRERLDAYSLASRLSYFLWNGPPDDALLKAAADGDLYTQKGRARAVDAMLASSKFEAGVRAFFDDMLGFDNFETLAKDPNVYPTFAGAAAEDAREQTLRTIIDHLVTQKGDYRDLFTTRSTFISKSLAPVYRQRAFVATPWTRYVEPPDGARAGLLTQISFLALHSHPGRSSPTLRGKALREILLCQPVPPPPANVDFSAVENPDPRLRTARDRLNFHSENPVCGGCHKITDPMGLALENFDGVGQYRETEKGAPIDASGILDGKPFKDAAGLGQALRDHPAVPACLVKRVYTYAMGGRFRREDQPLVTYFNGRFAAEGYQLPSLMRSIALSASFSAIDNGPESPEASAKTAGATSIRPATRESR